MSRQLTERRLRETGSRLRRLRADLAVADEQAAHLSDEADDARLRALVSETPGADRERRHAHRHAEAMDRHRDAVRAEIEQLEQDQDGLLDRLQEFG